MTKAIRATLALLVKRQQLLLEDKRKGMFGSGCLMGPGGRNLQNEEDLTCVIRETWEEVRVRVRPKNLKRIAEINSTRDGVPWFCVQVFKARFFEVDYGGPREMEYDWYQIGDLPWERMPPTDQLWLPELLFSRKKLRVQLHFDATGMRCDEHRIETLSV